MSRELQAYLCATLSAIRAASRADNLSDEGHAVLMNAYAHINREMLNNPYNRSMGITEITY